MGSCVDVGGILRMLILMGIAAFLSLVGSIYLLVRGIKAFKNRKVWLRKDEGRMGTGYYKMLLAQGKTWDCYILKYPVGGHIPEHTDPVHHPITGSKLHYRMNFLIKGERNKFGYRYDPTVHEEPRHWWRFILFRPDQIPHWVLPVTRSRYVLSIGWVKPDIYDWMD